MSASDTAIYRQMTRLAWRNVRRNWRHSMATILAIASGFMAVCLFDGFLQELSDRNYDGYSTRGMLGHVLVQKKDAQTAAFDDQWAYSIDVKTQKFLDAYLVKDPDFKRRVRFLSMAGMVTSGPNNAVFSSLAYDIKDGAAVRGERWEWNTLAGKPLHLSAVPGAVLGGSLGHLLDCNSTYKGPSFILEDGNYIAAERPFECKTPRITLSATTEAAQINAIDLPVVGLIDAGFREADKRAVNISLEDGQRLLDTDKITLMSIELKDPDHISAFVKRLKNAAKNAGFELDVMPWEEHSVAAFVQGGMQILGVFRNLFMVIVVTIGVMSVANTMMKSVNERIREVGTLRSLGFLRQHLVFMFSMEGMFLSFIACALGLIATVLVTIAIGHLGITYKAGILSIPIALKVRLTPMAWLASTVLLSLLATGTAWFCSKRASRMVIADAMRHV